VADLSHVPGRSFLAEREIYRERWRERKRERERERERRRDHNQLDALFSLSLSEQGGKHTKHAL
jgi:CRISPR/Cas system-associated protein Cas7 (RAMP superfamily)